jgi:hypothetical protein
MEHLHPATGWFAAPQPVVLALPHLITALDAELMGKVVQLTGSKPGIHPLPAPFDDQDRFDCMREGTPLAAWRIGLNQGEILAFSPLVQQAVFGSSVMFVDAGTDEAVLARWAATPGERLSTGAWVTRAYQDLPDLAVLVETCGWLLIPVGPERSRALFVTASGRQEWVVDLEKWCERTGRNCAVVRRHEDGLVLAESFAGAESRGRAIEHEIDEMLGRHETYFGEPDEALGGRVSERIRQRRLLQQEIAKARTPPPSAPG